MSVTETLYTVEEELAEGTILDRPNRFVLEVERTDGTVVESYISNTGAWNVTQPGLEVLISPVADSDRRTAWDVRFVRKDGVWVSVDAAFANAAFEAAFEKDLLPYFDGYGLVRSEPPLPDGGRADFELESPGGESVLVEVKSCTLATDGIARFPDRPTKRGRRHLTDLRELREGGTEAHVVFVIQRPDADRFEPNRPVDPEFATLLEDAEAAGVGIHAMQLRIERPDVVLERGAVPVDVSPGDD